MKISLELQPCLGEKSGIGVYTYELTKRLQMYKDLNLTGNLFNFCNKSSVPEELLDLNINQDICKLMSYGIYKRIWGHIPLNYNNLFKQGDLTHFFNVITPPNLQGKVVNTIHDITFILYPETIGQKHLKFLNNNLQHSVERPDKIITISKSSRQGIMEYLNVDPSKIEIVYPGVDYHYYNQAPSKVVIDNTRTKYRLPEQYILYMGTLEPRKNILGIVEAFAKFKLNGMTTAKSIKLVLAGKKGWLYEPIFEKIKQLGLEEEVVFTDYVDERDKVAIYHLASAFIFPSLYEGFGIPVLEAMAAGTPVITSNVSSLPEVAGEAAILISPQDTEGMACALNKVLENEEYARDLVTKGWGQAQKFSWDQSAEKLYSVYRDVLS